MDSSSESSDDLDFQKLLSQSRRRIGALRPPTVVRTGTGNPGGDPMFGSSPSSSESGVERGERQASPMVPTEAVPTSSKRREVETGKSPPQKMDFDPARQGVGSTFPTRTARDSPTPSSISADRDWLFLSGKHADHLLKRFRHLNSHFLTLHSPVSRIRNNDHSRVSLVSDTEHFQPQTPFSFRPATHPVPATSFPNAVMGFFEADGFVFSLSVTLLYPKIRKTNYFTKEEMAVLCAAMNVAKTLHTTLVLCNGEERPHLEKATKAMPPFGIADEGGIRKETRFKGLSGYYFLLAMRVALNHLYQDPNRFQDDGLVAKVKDYPLPADVVQECALALYEKSLWELSCAGCKQIGMISDYHKVDLRDKHRIREFVSRSLAMLQEELSGLFKFQEEDPPATFAVDYAVILEPLISGTSFVLDGIAAGQFAASLVGGSSNNNPSSAPSPITCYFDKSGSWQGYEDVFPEDWVRVHELSVWEDEDYRFITENDFPQIVACIEQYLQPMYCLDGCMGEPVYAQLFRQWTDRGCSGPMPLFAPDKLRPSDKLYPRPTWASWQENPDEPSPEERSILETHRGQFPFGVRGLRLMGHYDFGGAPLFPTLCGLSNTADRYRRWLWSKVDVQDGTGSHADDISEDEDCDSSLDGKSPADVTLFPEEELSNGEIDEVEAALMEEDDAIRAEAENRSEEYSDTNDERGDAVEETPPPQEKAPPPAESIHDVALETLRSMKSKTRASVRPQYLSMGHIGNFHNDHLIQAIKAATSTLNPDSEVCLHACLVPPRRPHVPNREEASPVVGCNLYMGHVRDSQLKKSFPVLTQQLTVLPSLLDAVLLSSTDTTGRSEAMDLITPIIKDAGKALVYSRNCHRRWDRKSVRLEFTLATSLPAERDWMSAFVQDTDMDFASMVRVADSYDMFAYVDRF